MDTLHIRSRIEMTGVNPYALVCAKEAARLKKDWHKPIPVRFRIDDRPDYIWRINLMPVGDGGFRLYLSGGIRKASKLGIGDILSAELQFDDEYRGGPLHPMPAWFGDELHRNPLAMRGWDMLIPSRQKEILRYFARLKSSGAKQRNLQRALHVLAGGDGRFMGRLWNKDGVEERRQKRSPRR